MGKRVFFEAASVFAASLTLLAITTGGCSHDDSSGGSAGGVPAEEPIAPSQTPQTKTASSQPLQANPCEDFGSLAGNALTARAADGSESFLLPLVNRPVTSRLGVLATGSAPKFVGKTVALGAGANANYDTCTH